VENIMLFVLLIPASIVFVASVSYLVFLIFVEQKDDPETKRRKMLEKRQKNFTTPPSIKRGWKKGVKFFRRPCWSPDQYIVKARNSGIWIYTDSSVFQEVLMIDPGEFDDWEEASIYDI